jgi:hypothetical protein
LRTTLLLYKIGVENKKEEETMQTIFEKMGITYRQEGDYLLPNLEPPESPEISIGGQRRLKYLRENKEILYMTMLMSGTLKDHLEEVDQSADEMLERLVKQMKQQERITEILKATNQMEWVQRMNNIRNRAEEIVYQELIYV